MKLFIDMQVDPASLESLRSSGNYEIDLATPPAEFAREFDPARIRDTDVLFCSTPPKNFTDMRAVKWVQIASAGYSQLFPHNLHERNIRATNARGCFDAPIAEWAAAMMINLTRNMRQLIRNQEAGIWDRSAVFQRELRGATVGIWGYGGIGREVGRLARQMGLHVHIMTLAGIEPFENVYYVPGTSDPDGSIPERVYKAGEEIEFLANLDFLVIAMPLTKGTEGIVGERELKALKRSAYVLNPARGPIIKQDALLSALRNNWIAGAALDTHYQYPMPADHPLWRFPNVIFTPHISGSSLSPNFVKRMWEIFSANIERFSQGKPLLNELTRSQLAGN